MSVVLESTGAIVVKRWEEPFYAHVDSFLVEARSVSNVIESCFGHDKARVVQDWFKALKGDASKVLWGRGRSLDSLARIKPPQINKDDNRPLHSLSWLVLVPESSPVNETTDLSIYKEALLFLATAGVVAPLFFRLRISPVLGYLLAGVALGPYGLGAIGKKAPWLSAFAINVESIDRLAAFGVVALLFTMGLELSFERCGSCAGWCSGSGSGRSSSRPWRSARSPGRSGCHRLPQRRSARRSRCLRRRS